MTIQDTSREAYESIAPFKETMTETVFNVIRDAGSHGCTDDEIEVILDGRHQTVSSRRWDLARNDRIVKTGERRINRSGCKANVWVVSKLNSIKNNTKVIYADYIQSDEWEAFKAGYYATHAKECYATGSTDNIELHHKHYTRLGEELHEDVIPLSKSVHEMVHILNKECSIDLHVCHEAVKRILDYVKETGAI